MTFAMHQFFSVFLLYVNKIDQNRFPQNFNWKSLQAFKCLELIILRLVQNTRIQSRIKTIFEIINFKSFQINSNKTFISFQLPHLAEQLSFLHPFRS